MNDQKPERLPPHDRDAELHVISSVLRAPEQFGDVCQEISGEDFYAFGNQKIWQAFTRLATSGRPIDPTLVWDELQAMDCKADVGGLAGMLEIWHAAPAAGNAAHHAKIIRKNARLRAVINAATEMQREAYEPRADVDEIVTKAADLVFELAAGAKTKTRSWDECVREALEALDRRRGKNTNGETEEGLKTGWATLDKLTCGMHKKELVILAARPSVGKTVAALNLIDAICGEGGRVFFASLEQSVVENVFRLLSKNSGLNSHKFRAGNFTEQEGELLLKTVDKFRGHKLWINDGAGQSLAQVTSETRRLKMQHGMDMVVIDYLGLMDGGRSFGMSRTEEIGRLSRGLKNLAKTLDVVVVCLSQLNRGSENRPDKTPRLSDLRDSGEIEQDADTVFMLHRTEDKDVTRETDKLEWLIEKQRNGPVGMVNMVLLKRTFEIRESY